MSSCPKCSHDIYVKAGKAKGRQRYKCKGCNYHYTVLETDRYKAHKRQAPLTLPRGTRVSLYRQNFEGKSCIGIQLD